MDGSCMRTTEELVRGVLQKDYDDLNNPSLEPYIDAAYVITNAIVACAAKKGITLGSTQLITIETWLGAHAYSMSDNKFSAKKTQLAFAKFQGMTGMNLEFTPYGQMAMTLDTSGCLRAMNKGVKIQVGWMGKLPKDRIDLIDQDD